MFITTRLRVLILIVDLGDKDSQDKKMGGSVAINCQWYNIAAHKGPGNPTCNGVPSENRC